VDVGKLPPDLLARYVLGRLGAPADALAAPPAPGHDACALDLGDRFLVIASDPALGVSLDHLGYLAVHYSASDVAVFGATPQYLVSDILLPPESDVAVLDTITSQMDTACRDLGISIIGGHSGVYPALAEPVVVTTVLGFTERLLSPANIRPGMHILLIKGLGGETACHLALSRQESIESVLGTERAGILRGTVREATCVAEAHLLGPWAVCMHDLTEGGLFGALDEMRVATGLGADLQEGALIVDPDVAKVLGAFNIDPCTTSSTGALIAFCTADDATDAKEALAERGIRSADIGLVTRGPVRVVGADGSTSEALAGTDGYSAHTDPPSRS